MSLANNLVFAQICLLPDKAVEDPAIIQLLQTCRNAFLVYADRRHFDDFLFVFTKCSSILISRQMCQITLVFSPHSASTVSYTMLHHRQTANNLCTQWRAETTHVIGRVWRMNLWTRDLDDVVLRHSRLRHHHHHHPHQFSSSSSSSSCASSVLRRRWNRNRNCNEWIYLRL